MDLLWQRARTQKAESVIRESEERFRLVTNTAPVMIWMSGPDRSFSYFNKPWLDFTGRAPEVEVGNGWTLGVHPEDLPSYLEAYERAFDRRDSFHVQYRLRRHDGEFRWIFGTGVPRFNADGSFAGYIGSSLDITERKLAEQALASLGGKLILAQEEERTRIARELHDDINQQLALLSVALDELRRHPPDSIAAIQTRLEGLEADATRVSTSVNALSHRLHSSKLEYLGLVAALRSFCREFSNQHQVDAKFSHDPIPDGLPPEISLCLFRVVQAALVNALKHSGVTSFDVHLGSSIGGVHLSVRDKGVGFDVDKDARQRRPRTDQHAREGAVRGRGHLDPVEAQQWHHDRGSCATACRNGHIAECVVHDARVAVGLLPVPLPLAPVPFPLSPSFPPFPFPSLASLTRSSDSAYMVGRRLIILLGIVTGVALELGIHALSRRREAWDSPQFWTIGLPLAGLAALAIGYLARDRDWTWAAVIVPSQVMTMMVRSGELGRLVAADRGALDHPQRALRLGRVRRIAPAPGDQQSDSSRPQVDPAFRQSALDMSAPSRAIRHSSTCSRQCGVSSAVCGIVFGCRHRHGHGTGHTPRLTTGSASGGAFFVYELGIDWPDGGAHRARSGFLAH